MKYFLLFFVSFSVFAAEKFYYINYGWFGPWPEEQAKVNGEFVQTPNGLPICEATIFDTNTNMPISYSHLERDTNDNILCPVQISEYRKNQESEGRMLANLIFKKTLDRQCGEKIVDFIAYKNDLKNLDPNQTIEISSVYSIPKMLLKDGTLDVAKLKIQEITPDGLLLTEQDKNDILIKIDYCINVN